MRLFRTRSVVVQAILVTGFNWGELEAFCGPGNFRRRTVLRPTNVEPDGIVGEIWHAGYRCWLPVRVADWIERSGVNLTPVPDTARGSRYQPLHG